MNDSTRTAQEQKRRSDMSARRIGTLLALGALLSLPLAVDALATHERPKATAPDYDALVTAYEPCPSPGSPINRSHAVLGLPACNPPLQDSDYLTTGTPDANGAPAQSVGYYKKKVVMGDPGAPPDDADIALRLELTDVRCRPALASATPSVCANPNAADGEDYSGELNARLDITKISDHANAPSSVPGTTVAFTQAVTVPCFETGPVVDDPSIGSTCSLDTSLDALVAGAVVEGKRAIWEFGAAEVLDGGSDGDVGTSGDGEDVFMVDGVFVP
jgi:hypothetical protein